MKQTISHLQVALSQISQAGMVGYGPAANAVDSAIAALVEELLQDALETELDQFLAESKANREPASRPLVRNGHGPGRPFITNLGAVTLRMPKFRGNVLRRDTFQSRLVGTYRRRAVPVGSGATWRFLRALLDQDWPTIRLEILGTKACRLPFAPHAGWQQLGALHATARSESLLARTQWAEIVTAAFPAPWHRTHASPKPDTDTAGETMVAVAARALHGNWNLVATFSVPRACSERWPNVAAALAHAGFKVEAVQNPIEPAGVSANTKFTHHI